MNISDCGQIKQYLGKETTSTKIISNTNLEMAFDFNKLFSNTLDGEFMYSHYSMAILGDSLSILKKMKDKSVQLIFADAPYNIGKNFGNNNDKWKNVQDYIDWCQTWLYECMRVLSDTGTMYFMTATQHMPYLDMFVSEHYNVLCRIIWAYDSSGVQSKKIYGSLYEPILMINKSKKATYTFNHEDILVEAKTGAKRKLIDYRKTPPSLTALRKYQVMFGILVVLDFGWTNTKTIQHKNQKLYLNAL